MRALNTLAVPFLLGALFLLISPVPAIAQTGLSTSILTIDEDASVAASGDQVQYAAQEMRARVWHGKDDDEVYARGEELRLYFRINQDAYVVMYLIDADGYADVLWPTSRFDDGFVFGGHTYSVPGRASQLPLSVSNVKGVEYVEVIASEYPFDLRELGLDFYFDMDEVTNYAHQVAGDPFLAVNDINYAITGLEEDVDWIVTDWTHIYIEEKVEYARYTCTSCHSSQEEQYSPYTDNCTQVTIYSDWGWYTNWYASFGYYPLYCDAPYYYWDRWYYRPYYYAYYPVYYGWASCGVYVRPYPVYPWRTHAAYNGDYLVRYQRGQASSPPLYNPDAAREASKGSERGPTRTPPSISARSARADGNGRVSQELLVRDTAPVRSAADRNLDPARGHTTSSRVGVRSGQARPTRTVRSLQTNDASREVQTVREGGSTVADAQRSNVPSGSGRRWTRPVVRNERDPNASSQTPNTVRGNRDTAPGSARVSPPADGGSPGARPVREVRSGAVPRREDARTTTPRQQTRSARQGGQSSTPARQTAQPRKAKDSSSGGGDQASTPARRGNRDTAAAQRTASPPRSSAQNGSARNSAAPPPRQSAPRSKASGSSGSRGRSSAGSRSGGGRG